MGRYSASDENGFVSGVITPSDSMPLTGVFGTGRVAFITASQAFVIPATSMRVRLWGCGGNGSGYNGGGGGGFALKVINGLVVGESVAVTLGSLAGSTTSFGPYVSAKGGTAATDAASGEGGVGVGGDINNKGGSGGIGSNQNGAASYGGGGGAANVLGKGGSGGDGSAAGGSAASGGGGGMPSQGVATVAGCGMAPVGSASLDFVGCGSGLPTKGSFSGSALVFAGAAPLPNAGNGGGGSGRCGGAFPGGGSGGSSGGAISDPLVVVEW